MHKTTKLLIYTLLILVAITAPRHSCAQYFDLGTSPHSIKWKQMQSNGIKYIFAEENLDQANRYMNYIDTLRANINFGFTHPAGTFPVLMQPQNLASNGLVMYAPKRMEINVPPDIETYSTPWLKHLAAHEYRHSVQFNNINQHFIKGLSYVIGEQSVLLGAALLSLWFMEGDAVIAETQMSEYGRGLQPSFSMEYRAAIDEMINSPKSKIDKWFCGSYKDNVPSHYNIGYQIVNYSYTKYGFEFWDKIVNYCSKYPFLIIPGTIARKKYYDTSSTKLFKETFNDLNNYWNTLEPRDNSATLLPITTNSFTTYNSPMPTSDSTILVLKTSFKRPSALVETNINTGQEKRLFYTGNVSTKPTMDSLGRVFWSEYRYSTFWDQRINSQLCYYDPSISNKAKSVRKERQALFPIGMNNGEVAFVKYNYNGTYSIKLLNEGTTIKTFDNNISIHGLCYDNKTQKFYMIALNDDGMSIISMDMQGKTSTIKQAAYISLSLLRAYDGKLYFNSIASGLDEAHMIDLAKGKEYQLTTSRYGSFGAMASIDNKSFFSTQYSTKGYLLAQQDIDTTKIVEYSVIPTNKVNPPRAAWDVPKIDKVIVSDSCHKHVKDYNKFTNLINIHSWAPISYNPNSIIDENKINVNIGATVMSQNILNSAVSYLSYAWTNYGSTVTAGFEYMGLAPKFSVDATYSTSGRLIYNYDKESASYAMPVGKSDDFVSVTANVYLPIYFSCGYHNRILQPSLAFYHDNTLFEQSSGKLTQNMQKIVASLYFSDQTRMATQDLLPRWGYALRLSYVANPFCKDFSEIYSAYASANLPGMFINHGITLKANVQKQVAKYWCYQQKELFPRGADYNFSPSTYYASSIDYTLPLCYPDWGINSIVYFKRISASIGYDFAHYSTTSNPSSYTNLHSYGVELLFDINLLRTPSLATSQFGVWIFTPSDTHKPSFGVSASLPL